MVMAILAFLVSYIGFKRLLSRSFGGHLVESYALLVGTALRLFNRRLVSILLQVIAASNLIYFFMSHLLSEKLTFAWKAMVVFDLTIILFTAVIAIILLYIPNSVAAIAHQDERTKDQVTQQIIYAGIFQNLSFFAVFICVLILGFLFLGSNGLIAASLGMLVISFYFRSAGGAYKAAAEQAESQKQDGLVLTHPSNILTNSGTMIASVGGFYLDVYSSWLAAITCFFVYVNHLIQPDDPLKLIYFAEVKWVLLLILLTGVGSFFNDPNKQAKKNRVNIYLDLGYSVLILMVIAVVGISYGLNVENTVETIIAIIGALICMMGIIFFTNYLTSKHHRAIQFIARQAQFGSANVLISSFFNGLFGNAIFMLTILIGLIGVVLYIDFLGLIMVVIYALSIVVVASHLKMFSLLSNQVMQTLDNVDNAFDQLIHKSLEKVSYTLTSIGNSLSTAAGVLSSTTAIATALAIFSEDLNVFSTTSILGMGLGIISMVIFYAISISGTYETMMESSKEISRQVNDIPTINEANKAHANIDKLADRHALNGLSAVTLPGVWGVVSLGIIASYLAVEGVLAALLGIIITLLIYSFFWAIFGDSVIAVYNVIKNGEYGGRGTSVFKGVSGAFLYAHYFQWVLAPTGVIMMKIAAMIAVVVVCT